MKIISSIKNDFIKQIVNIRQKTAYRKKSRKFIVEGQREITLAMKSNFEFESILFVKEIAGDFTNFLKKNFADKLIEISKDVYAKIAYRKTTEGVIGICKQKDLKLNNLKLSKKPLILIAESIEKPGNIGAMLRTCDAAGTDAFILTNPKTDIYNPNVIRASIGTFFSVPIAVANTKDTINFLNANNIKLYAATLQNSNIYYKENFSAPTAIAVGAEDKGLSPEIRNSAFKNIYIPMSGLADSMNVSVSAAILLFEAIRQRNI